MIKLTDILLEILSDSAKKKAKEKFKKENPALSDNQIDYYLDIFSRKQQSPVFKKKDIMQYKFDELEKLIDKEFPKKTVDDGEQVDFKGSEDVLYNENGLLILLGDLKEKCIRYGKGYSWCISRKDQSNMFFSYRMRLNESVFYFVFDEDKSKEDNWHAIVIYINKGGEYYVATSDNPGDKKMTWSEIESNQPKLKGLKSIFKHIPLSSEERSYYQRFKDSINDSEYEDLSFDEKEKYISFGHDLTEKQIRITPKALISKYATTTAGKNLPKDIEKSLSPSDQKVLKKNRIDYYKDFLENGNEELTVKLIYYQDELTEDDLISTDDLYLNNTPIQSLPDNLKVYGDLYLNNTPIKSLPDNLKVGGSLFLNDTLGIKSLPDNLKVGRGLYLHNSDIQSLPDNLEVVKSLNLSYTPIQSLPDNLKVGGNLYLNSSEIQSLPENLKVGGDLDLQGTKIKSLPENLKVGGTITLNDYLEDVYGNIFIKQSDIKKMKESKHPTSLKEILKDLLEEASRSPKGKKVPSKYLKGLKSKGEYGSKEAMKKEIDKFAGKDEYKKDWKADYKDGKRIKTKKGAATKAFEKRFGESLIFENSGIKDGVKEVFKNFPELSEIGTPEQYSKYLDTIFPDSKVKEIVYRGGNIPSEKQPIYFSTDKNYSEEVTEKEAKFYLLNITNPLNTNKRIFDIEGSKKIRKKYNLPKLDTFFRDFKEEDLIDPITVINNDSLIGIDAGQKIGNTIVVFEPEQIHILGSKQDIEGFKNFVEKLNSMNENIDKSLIGPHEYRGNNPVTAKTHYLRLFNKGIKKSAFIPEDDIQQPVLDSEVEKGKLFKKEKFVKGFGAALIYAKTRENLSVLEKALDRINKEGGETLENSKELGKALGYSDKEIDAWIEYASDFLPKDKDSIGKKDVNESADKALANKSKKSKISVSILRQVYNRGKAAWNQGHRPGVAQDQWAMGRVNSFITGVGGARKADKDLWAKAKKSKLKEMSKDDMNLFILAGEEHFVDMYVEKVQKESPNGIELSTVQSHFDMLNNPAESRDISFMVLSKLVKKNLLLKDGKPVKSYRELISHLSSSDKIAFEKLLNYSVNETK